MTTIYADNAATTQMSRAAIDAMLPYLETIYGNPSSLHSVGQQAAGALLSARDRIAKCLNASPREIYFTSGGSEADNQAILSAARLGERKGKKHIISTAFEHHAVLHTLQKLEKEGFEVGLLPVGPIGTVTAQQVKDAIREDTCLVSIMYANNEIGSILPIREIGAVCREAGAPVQVYANRSDMPGGSTLGSIATTKVSVPSVDIGLAQLAMHSCVETAGAEDLDALVKAMTCYYGKTLTRSGEQITF